MRYLEPGQESRASYGVVLASPLKSGRLCRQFLMGFFSLTVRGGLSARLGAWGGRVIKGQQTFVLIGFKGSIRNAWELNRVASFEVPGLRCCPKLVIE